MPSTVARTFASASSIAPASIPRFRNVGIMISVLCLDRGARLLALVLVVAFARRPPRTRAHEVTTHRVDDLSLDRFFDAGDPALGGAKCGRVAPLLPAQALRLCL